MHPGPSELQKRYGSSLPPSLRWGAVQPHNTRSNIRERPSRLRPSLTIHDAGKTRKLVPKIERRKEAERQRRPYAFTHHDPPAEHLLLRDRPEYADYPGADQGRTSPLEGYKPADRQRVEFVLDAFGRSTKTSPFQKEQSAARAFLDRTRLGRTRRKQATVEDVEDLKDVEDEVKKPTDDQGRASGVHRGEDAPTEQGSDQKAPPKAAADRDEQAFQTEMSKRLRNLGYTEKTIRIMVDEEAARVFKQNIEKKDRPVYPKIHRDYIEPATLRHYDLPWEYDRSDPNYIVILRDMDRQESQILFEHTKRLREHQRSQPPLALSTSPREHVHSRYVDLEPKNEYAYYRKRDKSTRDWNEVGILRLQADDDTSSDTSSTTPWFQRRREAELPLSDATTTTQRLQPFVLDDATKIDQDPATTTNPPKRTFSIRSSLSRSRPAAPHNTSTLKAVPHATYGDILQETSIAPPKLVMVPKANVAYGQALFHLQHFQHETMDFERFKSEVLQIPELQNARKQVEVHLREAQRLHEKLPHHGNSVRYMEEFCYAASVDSGQRDNDIFIACIPFYDLRPHGHQTEARLKFSLTLQRIWRRFYHGGPPETPSIKYSTSIHPVRTLFQSLNPKNNSRRDLKQVVCHMLPARDQRYLHLSQVWFLVINDDLIITCSTLAERELYGDLLQKPATATAQPPKQGVLNIHLKTPDEKLWLLKQDECSTYFDLAAHFSKYTTNFADDFVLLENGAEIFPHQWPIVVERSKTATLHLVLQEREHGMDAMCQETPATAALYAALGNKWFMTGLSGSSDGESSDTSSTDGEESQSTVIEAARVNSANKAHDSGQMQESSRSFQDGVRSTAVRETSTEEAQSSDDENESSGSDDSYVAYPLTREDIQNSARDALTIPPHRQKRTTAGQDQSEESTTQLSVDFSMSSSVGVFDEYLLYESLPGLTTSTYNDVLSKWCSSPEALDAAIFLRPEEKSNFKGNSELCEALGCQFDSEHDLRTGDEVQTSHLDGWLYADLLSGVRGLLNIYLPEAIDQDLEVESGKLLTAIITLVITFDETLASARLESCFIAIRRLNQAFRRLFSIARELELYSVTCKTLGRDQGRTPRDTLKHVVLALTLTVKALTDLGELLPAVKSELARRKTSLAKTGMPNEQTYAYTAVKECCSSIVSIAARSDDPSVRQKEKETLRERFDDGLERLEKMGRVHNAARSVLYNEYAWSRVQFHADCAWKQLLSDFKAALSANSSAQIQWKAAACPMDLMALVLPQVLWRPVLGDQDALDMYNQYVTDLESNILTGDPSREPLDRIRHLRHELNAFSQLQRQQIDVLEKIVDIACTSDVDATADKQLGASPHPRLPVFKALPESIRIQNMNIQQLNGMLDGLHNEARAQVSGVQDWRDNATVVFTTITIIFLPLSFVASVFGMNTSDVRNMHLNQWVFWASAAPFTLMVILITVYFVDVPPLWRWLERTGNSPALSSSSNGSAGREEVIGRVSPETGNPRTKFLASVARGNGHDTGLQLGVDGTDGDEESTTSGE